jgi:zinc transporter ZupT
MPVTINGAPTHVLIVHAVAVLLPMSVLAALLLVFVPATRRSFAVLTVGLGFAGCIAVPLAFLSGSALRHRLGDTALINRHVSDAHQLLPVAAGFGLSLAAFVVVDLLRRYRHEELNRVELATLVRFPKVRDYSRRHRLLALHRTMAALLVVTALLTAVAVVRAGDSGAQAAWTGRLQPASRSR